MQLSPRFRRKSSRSVCSIFLLRKISRLQFCCFERIQNLWSVSTKTLQPTITSNSSRGEWSVRQTQQACSQLNHHIPVLDLNRINGNPGVGIVGALLGWAGEDTCPYVVSFWLQRLRDHDLALEILYHAFIKPHFRGALRQ